MPVMSYRLADRFLILPTTTWFFGEYRNQENCLDVIRSFVFKDIAEIFLTRLGAIGLRFVHEGPLRSIDRLRMSGSGEVPEEVMNNLDEITELQARRLTFANFIAGSLLGKLMTLRQTALTGACYAGMDAILGFTLERDCLLIESGKRAHDLLAPKVRSCNERAGVIATPEHLDQAIAFIEHLEVRGDQFQQANLQACMVMNYQAAILHSEQHAAASLALNFSAAEALVNEIFHAYGLVDGRTPQSFATRPHGVPVFGASRFARKMRLADKVEVLRRGGLIDRHLFGRLDEARKLRNGLMHGAAEVTLRQSGTMQTTLRDLWGYLLDEPFELISSWSMRL